MYWSGLLPLTYLTVEYVGVNQFAEDVVDIYGWLAPGLSVLSTSINEAHGWWFNGWDIYWGSPTVRCLDVLQEVIVDLEMNLYGDRPER
jgi:hypothetical protein